MPPPAPKERRCGRTAKKGSNLCRAASEHSVHFELEPVARDVQRQMEQQLWRWLRKTHNLLYALDATARGSVQVMERAPAKAATPASPAVVVKTVAVTLPPHREQAHDSPEDEDVSWSRMQLMPNASLVLWEQRSRRLRHVAGVVDVFTLASMMRDTREGSLTKRSTGSTNDNGPTRLCTSFLGSSSDTTVSGRVPLPLMDTNEFREQGWSLDLAMDQTSQKHHQVCSCNATSRLPHPTVFLYAREYINHAHVLWHVLQERWGRERLPVTTMPTWVNTVLVFGSDDPEVEIEAASSLTEEALEKLRRHVERWLKGLSSADKAKKRVAGKAVASVSTYKAAMTAAASSDEEALTPHDAADILWGVCTAVARLHRAGLVHGNLKPNNVLIRHVFVNRCDPQMEAKSCEVHVTDHLLPLMPDKLVEPGALLTLPTPVALALGSTPAVLRHSKSVTMSGYVCVKLRETAEMPYLCGGGPHYSAIPPAFSLSGLRVNDVFSADDNDLSLEGGVDSLSSEAYEAVMLLHLAAPENVLLVAVSDSEVGMDVRGRETAAAATLSAGNARFRVWLNVQNATPASDVYALGVLLYMMLVGRLPPLPRYRRASQDASCTAVVGARPQPAYVEVIYDAVRALYESAGRRTPKHDPSQALDELKAFLRTAAAGQNLPLTLSLARAGVQPVAMDILVGMLHVNPAERLTLAQLQHHAFFQKLGRRRHALRAELKEVTRRMQFKAPVKDTNPLRNGVVAAAQRRTMPQNMGATAKTNDERPPALPMSTAGSRSVLEPSTPSDVVKTGNNDDCNTSDSVASPASPDGPVAPRSIFKKNLSAEGEETSLMVSPPSTPPSPPARLTRVPHSVYISQSRCERSFAPTSPSDTGGMKRGHCEYPRHCPDIHDTTKPRETSVKATTPTVPQTSPGTVREPKPLKHREALDQSHMSQKTAFAPPVARSSKAEASFRAPRRSVVQRPSAWTMQKPLGLYAMSLVFLFIVRLRRRRERTSLLNHIRRYRG